jgi:hypothetical protein
MNYILDNIKTEAGKRLWTKMNNSYGSSVWGPVGDGIVEIEAEVEARIIKLLEDEQSDWLSHDGECDCRIKGLEIKRLIALIKKQRERSK